MSDPFGIAFLAACAAGNPVGAAVGAADSAGACAVATYADADGDLFGDPASEESSCELPSGRVTVAGDCNDGDPEMNPGATETCGYDDLNCDGDPFAGAIDPGTWYADADGDGYGTSADTLVSCVRPDGYAWTPGDCNDAAWAIHPGAPEWCDTVDHDCDGDPAEADSNDAPTWYLDSDSDGFGDLTHPTNACSQPSGYVSNSADCDDNNAEVGGGCAR